MLIADKRHTGLSEVVGKIQRFGINRRDPSMADFLIMRDPTAEYQDSRDLERPPGLPKLHRSHVDHSTAMATPAARLSPGEVTMHPSAADGISTGLTVAERNTHMGENHNLPGAILQSDGAKKNRGKWGKVAAEAPAHIPSTGIVQGDTLMTQHPLGDVPDHVEGGAQTDKCASFVPVAQCHGFVQSGCKTAGVFTPGASHQDQISHQVKFNVEGSSDISMHVVVQDSGSPELAVCTDGAVLLRRRRKPAHRRNSREPHGRLLAPLCRRRCRAGIHGPSGSSVATRRRESWCQPQRSALRFRGHAQGADGAGGKAHHGSQVRV